jgi:hypothetical protein
MGALYLARDPALDRLVAIKLLRYDYQEDPELRERFIREARSVARLRHPNIIIVHDVGEDDGRPFMAMEYIDGETLGAYLKRQPPAPLSHRLSLIEDLCAGLGHAHDAGIIHRDIKPPNIMLTGTGVLKVLDFGIARTVGSGMTQDGMMMGTVPYMSPEQLSGSRVDCRSDIFSAGAVLYETIALTQAFPGSVDGGLLKRILSDGPVPLERHVPDVDRELAGIVARSLERDPEQRYQDVSALQRDIMRVRRRLHEPEEAGAPGASSRDTIISRPATSGAARRSDSDRRRRLNPERFAELQRQQVAEHLRVAEQAFTRGDHEAALHSAERAATVDPDSAAAFDLIDRARFAIGARAARQLIAEAHRLLSSGQLDDAAVLVDEASLDLPDVEGANQLREELRRVAGDVAAAREREHRIAILLERARSADERGAYDSVISAVHEILALDPEQSEGRLIERQARMKLEALREHQRAREEAYGLLQQARTLAGDGRFEESVRIVDSVNASSESVRIAATEVRAEIRKAERQRAIAAAVTRARDAFDGGRFEEALAALDTVLAEDQTADTRALRAAIEHARAERREYQRKRQALDEAIDAVRSRIDRGEPAEASERLEDALRIGLDDERLGALRQEIAALEAAVKARRRGEARDRIAAKRVEAARALLADGDADAAAALLVRDGSGHPLIEQALREIRAAMAEQEERSRQAAERLRAEEEARRRTALEAVKRADERRRDEVEQLLDGAEQALSRHEPDEATMLLQRAERIDLAGGSELIGRLTVIRAAAAADLRRQAEAHTAEVQRRERAEAVEQRLAAAAETDDHETALRFLAEARAMAPEDPRLDGLLAERRRALDQQRAEARQRLEEARRREEERLRLREEAQRAAVAARAQEDARREAAEDIVERTDALRAERVADEARGLFDGGRRDEAMILLRAQPASDLMRTALEELDSRHVALERQQERDVRQAARATRRAAAVLSMRRVVTNRRVQIAAVAAAAVITAALAWRDGPAAPAEPVTTVSSGVAAQLPTPAEPTSSAKPRANAPAPPIATGARPSARPAESTPTLAPPRPPSPTAGPQPPAVNTATTPSPGGSLPPAESPPPSSPSQAAGTEPASAAIGVAPAAVPNPPPTQPSTNPPPAAESAPPAGPDLEADRAEIARLLERYVAAYSSMDEGRVREIERGFRGIPSRNLLKSVELHVSHVSIVVAPDGQSAELEAATSFNYVWVRAGFPATTTGRLTWKLAKVGGAWRVAS